MDLHAVAQVGAGRDGQREERCDGAPRHLAHVAEDGLSACVQLHDPDIGALPGRLVGCVATEREEAPGGVEGSLGDGVELAGIAVAEVHDSGLVADGLVLRFEPLAFVGREVDGPRQPPAVRREGRRRSPREDARRVLIELADPQLRVLVDPLDDVRDPVAEGGHLQTSHVLPATVVVGRNEGTGLG